VNTFLPCADYAEGFRTLDTKRLGKQRLETLQIARHLVGVDPEFPWGTHPCVRMWRGYAHELCRYGLAACAEWTSRGHADSIADRLTRILEWHSVGYYDFKRPAWTLDPRTHLSHRSNLIRKDRAFYSRWWPDIPADLPYIWWWKSTDDVWHPVCDPQSALERMDRYIAEHSGR
jgi:hypothetical protein